jgi:hypothetical protein
VRCTEPSEGLKSYIAEGPDKAPLSARVVTDLITSETTGQEKMRAKLCNWEKAWDEANKQ